MRQARAAMRSGAASSRDAVRQAVAATNPKWQPGLSPLEEEEKLKVIVPTSAQQVRQINSMIDTLLAADDLDDDVRKALALWKTNYQMESVPDQVRRAFLEGFWCWLLGRGTDEDTRRTLWGRGNVAAHNREVAAYLELFARKRTEYAARLVLMAEHVPDTLNGFYLYYKVTNAPFGSIVGQDSALLAGYASSHMPSTEAPSTLELQKTAKRATQLRDTTPHLTFFVLQYIVKGALKKVQDPNDPSKWFYSLEDEQFLEDWDLFEQEGGNYAHMIAPAANRPANKQPWGGDEENTPAMDPYPATASDRKLEACMDNLAQQILNLNQSLSISHAVPEMTEMVRRQSASFRRKTQSTTGNAAVGDAGTEFVENDVAGVDDEQEFDEDGGDGKDDTLNQSIVFAEKLNETNASLDKLSENISRLIELQHIESPQGLRKQVREERLAAREEMKAATGEATTPQAVAAIEKAADALRDINLSFNATPSTPMSPANAAVQSLTPVQPTKPFTVAELQQHKAAINAQYEAYMREGRDKESLERARQRELAAVDAFIATLQERESFGSLSDLHSSGTMAALPTAQTVLPAAVPMSASVNLADSGTPVAPLEQSSSEGTPLGILAARQRMRALATAPTKGKRVTERDSDGEVIEGKELGFGDSEGSSAALSEHSSDRDFVVGDSAVESSGAASSVQENTATISDGSEIADSLMDVSAVMQASNDDSFQPAAKEVAKAAVAVQHAVTRASKKKEEEMKKHVHFDYPRTATGAIDVDAMSEEQIEALLQKPKGPQGYRALAPGEEAAILKIGARRARKGGVKHV